MKLANLTLAQSVLVAAALSVTACDPDDGAGNSESATSGSASDDTGESNTGSSTAGESSTDPSETGDSTGSVPEGLGCDPPPACDKGEFDGEPVVLVTNLAEAEALAGYTSITGELSIAGTDLECLTIFSCLETVGHDLTIFDNDLLTDVTGLNNITDVGFITEGPVMPGGTVVISDNDALLDFNGLNNIQQTPRSLSIAENASLTAISGFKKIVGVRENFGIRFNPNLVDIASPGLRSMLFIGGECVVTNNENLCITTVQDMCEDGVEQGPFGGNTANNDQSC